MSEIICCSETSANSKGDAMDLLHYLWTTLQNLAPCWWLSVDAVLLLALAFCGASLCLWTLLAAFCLWNLQAGLAYWIAYAVLATIFNILPFRRIFVSTWILKLFRLLRFMPKMSAVEKAAINAGNVWIQRELFSGKPDFKKLLSENYPELTAEEKDFLNGPVEELCALVNDWEIYQQREIPPSIWELFKKHRLFGMIIPKEYGGHGFSALAHSEVVMKISTRSIPVAITVMVPNSLGPAELLIHYGTQAQKEHYLPRLARGEEIPCFALTEPGAGSDAGSITSQGNLFKAEDGKLYMRLTWNKRYITLVPLCTVIGLAFRLYDPENLLGKGNELGITCALIPAKTQGVSVGRYHDPLGVPFLNGPTEGRDVVVPLDCVVGGVEGVGKGWQMVMECLAAGRGISLPAQSAGMAKSLTRIAGAYATVRKQFGSSLGKFEGIAELLARIGSQAYMLDAARLYTLGAIDKGLKPPVITALMKYHSTEIGRKVWNDGMDILGGAAICRGPRNLLANAYRAIPIAVTVEGANILTRSLIIFSQGALRSHPYALQEILALEAKDVVQFDHNFWKHIGLLVRNSCRAILLSVSRGRLASGAGDRHMRRYFKKLAWASASFAILADLAMGTLGGKLKIKERLTARLADILSWMYLSVAVLRRYEAEGRKKEDQPLLHWNLQHALYQMQLAFDGLFRSMDIPYLGFLLKGPFYWWSRINILSSQPSDELDNKIVQLLRLPGEQRDRLTSNIYIPKAEHEAMAHLEKTFAMVHASDAIQNKIRLAVKNRLLPKAPVAELYTKAVEAGVISKEEQVLLQDTEKAVNKAIQVDAFSWDEYKNIK